MSAHSPGQEHDNEPYDRRPRWLRRILPMCFATSVPLTGEQMARIHVAAFH